MHFARILVVDHDLAEAGDLVRRVDRNFSEDRTDRHPVGENFAPSRHADLPSGIGSGALGLYEVRRPVDLRKHRVRMREEGGPGYVGLYDRIVAARRRSEKKIRILLPPRRLNRSAEMV